MIRYFKKILPTNMVTLSNGKGFTFPAYPSGVGLLAVSSEKRPDLLRDFDLLIARQVGGVSEITQQEFEDEKKKAPRKSFQPESFSVTQVAQMRVAADRAAAALADTERARRQLTPTINRSFKRPGMKLAGATANPEPGDQPFRPGLSDRP